MKRKIVCLIVIGSILSLILTACSPRQEIAAGETVENGKIVEEPKGYFRVLIAGSDRASGLYDVLMLASWNRDTGEVWVLQLPRDTYAAYAEQSYQKLNGAPAALGCESFCDFQSFYQLSSSKF